MVDVLRDLRTGLAFSLPPDGPLPPRNLALRRDKYAPSKPPDGMDRKGMSEPLMCSCQAWVKCQQEPEALVGQSGALGPRQGNPYVIPVRSSISPRNKTISEAFCTRRENGFDWFPSKRLPRSESCDSIASSRSTTENDIQGSPVCDAVHGLRSLWPHRSM